MRESLFSDDRIVPQQFAGWLFEHYRAEPDARCGHCGYSLRTLSAYSLCPECGGPVWLSSLGGRRRLFGAYVARPVFRIAITAIGVSAVLAVAMVLLAARLPLWAASAAAAAVILPAWQALAARRASRKGRLEPDDERRLAMPPDADLDRRHRAMQRLMRRAEEHDDRFAGAGRH